MRLLPKKEAEGRIKKENNELIDTNIRLRKYYKDILQKLNTIKDSYEPDKLKKLADFEEFCKELQLKQAKLLQEYKELEAEIERKKEIYYGLIEKQDALEEKVHQMKETEAKLNLRQSFVEQLEQKQRELVK